MTLSQNCQLLPAANDHEQHEACYTWRSMLSAGAEVVTEWRARQICPLSLTRDFTQMLRSYRAGKRPITVTMCKGQKLQMHCRWASQRCQKASTGQQARSKDLMSCRLWPASTLAILQEVVSLEVQREGKHTAHVISGFPASL